MDIPFTKAHGTGNDFIIIYNNDIKNITLNKQIIKQLCDRNIGVGADGLIFISDSQKYDYKMDYYNNDGSFETFCANGARCATLFMHNNNLIDDISIFEAGDGIHKAKIKDSTLIQISMIPPKFISPKIKINGYWGRQVDSGALHFAVLEKNLEKINITKEGFKIRSDIYFSPKGTNVNFFSIINENTLHVKTYEKGVEKYMLSCGSGSVASAYYASTFADLKNNLDVIVPGGKLIINYKNNWKDVLISGKAQLVFKSVISI